VRVKTLRNNTINDILDLLIKIISIFNFLRKLFKKEKQIMKAKLYEEHK
jgi:hypothetical protein